MTMQFRCDEKERLLSYLYGEDAYDDRVAMEAHLATCAECREEIAELRSVRADLARWQPPDAELNFRVVRDSVAPPTRSWWHTPAWAPLALAAGVLLAVGAAAANVEVQVGNGALTIRTGWAKPAATPSTAVASAAPTATHAAPMLPVKTGISEAELERRMGDLESRLRAEMASSRRLAPATAQPVALTGSDRGQLLQQVQALVDESERRQQRELALRLAQVVQDFDTQRRADLVRIEQGFGQIESLTGQEAARQRAITNYLVRASQRQ
jgi:hypothetical protein